ncbi:DNA-binding protein [Morganella morganii]|uniref:helix-turn-helix domain-containing protein n=1 Tax=Morganella morganii TaxID=582 RepID=UPI0006C64B95|nr:helix-turn-helix transcriptional regulator [Morganella morganii]KOO18114.1 DNA-binding protein [Morganella morganii]
MKDINEVRKDNLIFVLEKYYDGKQNALADALGCAPNIISRYLSSSSLKSHRNISNAVARKIEYTTRMQKSWMDADHYNQQDKNTEDVYSPTEIGAILADNINTFMLTNGIKSQTQLSAKSKLGQSTINRIIKNETSATVDSVDFIAKGLGCKAYELLIPSDDTNIIRYDQKQYATLSPAEKEQIEDFIEFIIGRSKYKSL